MAVTRPVPASSPIAPPLPFGLAAAVVARSLLLQAAWNYRTLQGTGAAYALLPALRRAASSDEALSVAVSRHAGQFNAHPYLASLALGALARLEMDGEDADTIARFRAALGGPLGALGDKLVWAAWLPLCAVLATALYFAGAAPWVTAIVFLVVYNAGHLTLRVWGFIQGWHAGSRLGRRLKELDLAGVASRLEGWLAGAMGILAGFVLVGPLVSGDGHVVWGSLAGAGFLVGVALGPKVWRAAAVATAVAVGGLLLVGFLR